MSVDLRKRAAMAASLIIITAGMLVTAALNSPGGSDEAAEIVVIPDPAGKPEGYDPSGIEDIGSEHLRNRWGSSGEAELELRPIKHSYFDSNGKLTARAEFEYDDKGNLISRELSDASGENTISERYVYEYDEGGRKTSLALYGNRGGLVYSEEYVYDDNGQLSVMTRRGPDGKRDHIYEYGYDGNGRVVRLIKTYGITEDITNEYDYDYDASGNLTGEMLFTSNGSIADKKVYECDGEGRRISETRYDAAGEMIDRTEYEYDAAGNRTASTYTGASGMKLRNETGYEYDIHGNVTRVVFRDIDGNVTSESRYVTDGNSERMISSNAGGVTGITETEYDSEGRPVRITEYVQEGEAAGGVELNYQ